MNIKACCIVINYKKEKKKMQEDVYKRQAKILAGVLPDGINIKFSNCSIVNSSPTSIGMVA